MSNELVAVQTPQNSSLRSQSLVANESLQYSHHCLVLYPLTLCWTKRSVMWWCPWRWSGDGSRSEAVSSRAACVPRHSVSTLYHTGDYGLTWNTQQYCQQCVTWPHHMPFFSNQAVAIKLATPHFHPTCKLLFCFVIIHGMPYFLDIRSGICSFGQDERTLQFRPPVPSSLSICLYEVFTKQLLFLHLFKCIGPILCKLFIVFARKKFKNRFVLNI